MFKNLAAFRLTKTFTAAELTEQLGRRPFMPCGSQDFVSKGWANPFDASDESLTLCVGDHILAGLKVQERVLPAAAVRDELAHRVQQLEAQQGFKPGRKQQKEMKEAIIREMLPKAFTKSSIVRVWFDLKGMWMGVDAASPAKADGVVEVLRQTLDDVPIKLLRTELSPTSVMADWLAGEPPAGFTFDDECELVSPDESRATVRFKNESHHTIPQHLQEGKQPKSIALTHEDSVSFTLTDRGQIKKISFTDMAKEAHTAEAEDAAELAAAEFYMFGELSRRLLDSVVESLGGEMQPAEC